MTDLLEKKLAKTLPGQRMETNLVIKPKNVAVSYKLPFEAVEHLLEGIRNPKRPSRNHPDEKIILEAIKKLSPSSTELHEMAQQFPPPQRWYDEPW